MFNAFPLPVLLPVKHYLPKRKLERSLLVTLRSDPFSVKNAQISQQSIDMSRSNGENSLKGEKTHITTALTVHNFKIISSLCFKISMLFALSLGETKV